MADYRGDQADGLRRLFGKGQTRVVTFAAGTAGVGRSVIVAYLAAILAESGREVLVVDENRKSSIAKHFGVAPRHDLLHVLNEDVGMGEALVTAGNSLRILSAAKAVKHLGHLSIRQQDALIQGMTGMGRPVDVILVDASQDHPLGFSPFGLAAHETVVVMSPSGEAITDAYALIKKVSLGYARRSFRLLINRGRSASESRAIFDNMARLSRGRGVAQLAYVGFVPNDDLMRHASRLHQPVSPLLSDAPALQACRMIANDLLSWPLPEENAGGLEQFVHQLLHLSQHIDPQPIYA